MPRSGNSNVTDSDPLLIPLRAHGRHKQREFSHRHLCWLSCITCKGRPVKSDDDRPPWHQCSSLGRICTSTTTQFDPSCPVRCALTLPICGQSQRPSPSNGSNSAKNFRTLDMEYFQLYRLDDTTVNSCGLPYTSIAFSIREFDSPVHYAASALACLNCTSADNERHLTRHPKQFSDAVRLYDEAIAALREYVNRAPARCTVKERRSILLAALLLFSFDIASGRFDFSLVHLQCGLNIISAASSTRAFIASRQQSSQDFATGHSTAPDVLGRTFLSLASVYLDSAILPYNGGHGSLTSIRKESGTVAFRSLRDASVCLDLLCGEVCELERQLSNNAALEHSYQPLPRGGPKNGECRCLRDCWAATLSRYADAWHGTETLERRNDIISALSRWRARFSFLPHSDSAHKSVMLLEMQYIHALLIVNTLFDHQQIVCDRFRIEFERAVSIAELYLHDSETLSDNMRTEGEEAGESPHLGDNLATYMYLVIERCRNAKIRRRGLQIISKLDLGGIFSRQYLVSYCQHLVSEEEKRARTLYPATRDSLRGGETTHPARFRQTSMCDCNFDSDGGCEQPFGRMVYVIWNNELDMLQSGESHFRIDRTS